MARRKAGALLPIELAILEVAASRARDGEPEVHGFALARLIQERDGARRLTAHGTLYKALARMEAAGLLESRWENAQVGLDEGRPRRRLYSVTPLGAQTAVRVGRAAPDVEPRPGWAW